MKEPTRHFLNSMVVYTIAILALYYAISCMAYAFRHPEKTQTQILLDFSRVIHWQ